VGKTISTYPDIVADIVGTPGCINIYWQVPQTFLDANSGVIAR